MVRGGMEHGWSEGEERQRLPPSLSSPSPLQGEGRGGGRGVAAYVHPDPPPDLPPVRGEEYGWPGGDGAWIVRGGGASTAPSVPFFSLSLAGGGSGWGSRRCGIRPSGPPSRPPPCQGGGVCMVRGDGAWIVRGEERQRLPPSLSSPSPLQGEGRGGGRGVAAYVHPDPPPDLPPVRGEEYQWSGGMECGWSGGESVDGSRPSRLFLPLPCRGRVGVGVAALRHTSIRTPLPTSPLSGGRSINGQGGGARVVRGERASTVPAPPVCFSLSLAGGGPGWGSRRCGIRPSGPPSRPPPCSGGRSMDGQGGMEHG